MLRRNRRARLALCACLLSASCGPLVVKGAVICDDFQEGKCTGGAPENGTYRFDLPAEKTKTWFDLAYHMYFHSRQTPGMRVEFSRGLKKDEESFRASAKCFYRLEKGEKFVEDHMEGMRWDEDGSGLWCFDYLGTMLVKFHKKYGTIQARPSADFSPVLLTMRLENGPGAAQVQESVSLDWRAQ